MSNNVQLVIVRRSQFATFGLLAQAFADEPNVRLIWDRRVRHRRRQITAPGVADLRRGERRRDPSATWSDRDYVVLSTTADNIPTDLQKPSLGSVKALTAVRMAREDVQQDIEAAAQSDLNVLISRGDPLTRKALAHRIHRRSDRRHGPLVVIDRGGAGELFGSFGLNRPTQTLGPEADHRGTWRTRSAVGGTLLIDDVADLSWEQQTEFLLFLERHAVQRKGTWTHDLRIITGTSDWLLDRIASSQFRADLYYRLNLIHVVLPQAWSAVLNDDESMQGAPV